MQYLRLLAAGLTFALTLAAQQPVYTVRVDVTLVSLDVAAFDAQDRPLAALSQEDFEILEDGVPQTISSFIPIAVPYNILLLFDQSASTRGQRDLMRSAVVSFLDNLRPQDKAAFAVFGDGFRMLADWRATPEKTTAALRELARSTATGGTDFYKMIERSVEREFRGVSGRRAAVVLSDGRDTSLYKRTVAGERVLAAAGDREFLRALQVARDSRIPLYFVALNTDRNLGDPPGGDYLNLRRVFPQTNLAGEFLREARTRMEQLADVSGGRVFFPESLQNIEGIYHQISRELSNSYSLSYAAPKSQGGAYRRIEVKVRQAGARVRQSRDGY